MGMATLFAGYHFCLLGEAKCTNVRTAIENGGGIVTDDDTEMLTLLWCDSVGEP